MNAKISILRANGNKVRVKHCRAYRGLPGEYLTRRQFEDLREQKPYLGEYKDLVLPKGGVTSVQITTPEGDELEGIAVCSERDAYSRKKGLSISIGRALIKHSAN